MPSGRRGESIVVEPLLMTDPGGSAAEPRIRHLPVTRTARVALLGPEDAKEVWLVLHGYGQLAGRFIRAFLPVAHAERLIVAPEALSRFYTSRDPSRVGATWMTSEARESEIADYLKYLDTVVESFAAHAARLQVHGFSQGTATATRWIGHTSRRVDRLVLWGGEIAKEEDPGALAERQPGMRWDLCVGRSDQFVTEAAVAGQTGRLDSAGIPYTLHWFDGGHEVHPDTLVALVGRA